MQLKNRENCFKKKLKNKTFLNDLKFGKNSKIIKFLYFSLMRTKIRFPKKSLNPSKFRKKTSKNHVLTWVMKRLKNVPSATIHSIHSMLIQTFAPNTIIWDWSIQNTLFSIGINVDGVISIILTKVVYFNTKNSFISNQKHLPNGAVLRVLS